MASHEVVREVSWTRREWRGSVLTANLVRAIISNPLTVPRRRRSHMYSVVLRTHPSATKPHRSPRFVRPLAEAFSLLIDRPSREREAV